MHTSRKTPGDGSGSWRGPGLAWGWVGLLGLVAGCAFIPQPVHQPVIHNPFPQFSKVAVAPFFNLSSEASVDGRQFALAYFAALQEVPGFEVVPLGTVEQAMRQHSLSLEDPAHVRRLAQILEVDAVVVGAVTEFTPYYPPRCGLHVEWYAANHGFHEIPPGYGLPFGTPEEEQIPAPLVFEAEMALARAQLKGHTPPLPEPQLSPPAAPQAVPEGQSLAHAEPGSAPQAVAGGGPATVCEPHEGAILRHTKIYHGHDQEFTAALASYYGFRDDARFGGWQSYLQRSDDFIRFCCHLHISEMLSARGGAGETRVVWQWATGR